MSQLEPVRRSITVACDAERAFRLFTEEIDSWWPVEMHSRAVDEFEDERLKVERVEFQGRVGGRVLEHMSDGQALPWGEVTVWEPPTRVVLAWKPNSNERPPTEVEVRFTPAAEGTLVELEHRGWETLGPEVAETHADYAAGWGITLERFAAKAEEVA